MKTFKKNRPGALADMLNPIKNIEIFDEETIYVKVSHFINPELLRDYIAAAMPGYKIMFNK